ncbi:MAG TPA: LytTR family transcriptional regulator [Ignavibacteria bacterium]|nr:LytTR family transcriptional regulator [Ignavibacteria bacterium]
MKTNYNHQKGQKLIVNEKARFHQIDIERISHISCDGYLSIIYILDEKENISVSHLLKDFEGDLSDMGFFRVNRNTLINLSHVDSYQNNGKPIVKMLNNKEFIISRRRLSAFLKII